MEPSNRRQERHDGDLEAAYYSEYGAFYRWGWYSAGIILATAALGALLDKVAKLLELPLFVIFVSAILASSGNAIRHLVAAFGARRRWRNAEPDFNTYEGFAGFMARVNEHPVWAVVATAIFSTGVAIIYLLLGGHR